jgi:hypothetical protein
MKKILIILMLIGINLIYAKDDLNSQKICAEKLKEITSIAFYELPLPAIEEVDLRHSFSSSSSTGKDLDFLDFDTKICKKSDGESITHYWSIVSLFALNTGHILIPEKRVKEYDAEIEEYSIEKPFIPTDNEKIAKENIRKILRYYNSLGEFEDKNITINDFNIISLDKRLIKLRNSFPTNENNNTALSFTLMDADSLLLSKLKEILRESKVEKRIQKRKNPAIFLSKIIKVKKMYNNHSWFAMNFYNKQYQEVMDKYGNFLETPFDYVESELITNDMNDTGKKYQYYILKDGKINKDINFTTKYHYFLAEEGIRNPLKEMEATLHYFFDNPNKTQTRTCEDYPNRYILLKQLFKGNDTFQKATRDIKCSRISTKIDFFYGYFTTGRDNSESFGHSVLLIKTKGEYRSTNIKNSLDTRYAKNNPKVNITNMKEFYLNFAVDDPEEGFFNGLAYNVNGMIGNINGTFKIQKQPEIDKGYRHRMLVQFPITALNNNTDKRELLSAQIEHIQDNIGNFQIPYRFVSKNCAYVFANILEVPFPELRDKFNDRGYFTFKPKDIIDLMKGKIDVSKHKAIRL